MNENQIKVIKGIWAVAIIQIIIDHYYFVNQIYTSQTFPYTFFRDGMNGIFLIFVSVSYYVSAEILNYKSKYKTPSMGVFYTKRLIYIIPSLYIYLILIKYSGLYGKYLSDKSVFSAMTFTFNYLGSPHHDVLMHFWAFCAEESFLFIFTPLLFVLSKKNSIIFFSALGVGSLLLRVHAFYGLEDQSKFDWYKYMQTHLHLYALCSGVLIALINRKIGKIYTVCRLHWFAGVYLLLVGPYFEKVLGVGYMWLGKPIMSSLCLAVVVHYLLSNSENLISKLLSSKLMVSLGSIYFSLYIWQQPFTFDYFKQYRSVEGVLICTILSLFAGILAYFLIEKTTKKLGDYIFSSSN